MQSGPREPWPPGFFVWQRVEDMSQISPHTHSYAARGELPPLRAELRCLIILALPMVATTVSRMAIGFIDFVMVSFLGTDATAAISPSVILVFTIQCLGMGAATSV